ncbi:MAG: hypothetical protein HYZ65_15070 [Burkholderiales bacterium]|nr:hypothetical protein [Burkholderiales bacterium]
MQSTAYPLSQESGAAWLATVPVPVFGAALGLTGLSVLAQIHPRLVLFPALAHGNLLLGVAALAASVVLHLLRLVRHRAAFKRDLQNAAIAPFFGQPGIALLLLAEALHGSAHALAGFAFYAASLSIVAASLWWIYRMTAARLALASVSPSWLVPPIGCWYIAVLAPGFQLAWLAFPALLCGALAAVFSIFMLALRLSKGPALPGPARPALAIFFALPALILLWATAQAQEAAWLARCLYWLNAANYVAGALIFCLLLRRRFVISWWAFGMPLSATSIALTLAGTAHFSQASMLADATAASSIAITAILSVSGMAAAWRHMKQA